MKKETKKWLYTTLVFLIGALMVSLCFLLQDYDIAGLIGIVGIIVATSSIGVFYKFHDVNVRSPKLKMVEDEIKFKHQLDFAFVSNDTSGIIGFSDSKELLYLFSRLDIASGINESVLKNQFEIISIPYKNINQINIIENDMTIVKSNKSELIGKSVKGGFGNKGIGNKNSIQRIRVQVVTDDVINPSIDVFLFNSGYALKVNSEDYNKYYEEINKWFNHVESKLVKGINV